MERNSNGKENATHSHSSRKNTIDRHKKNKNWDLQHLDRYHNIVRAFKPHTHTHTHRGGQIQSKEKNREGREKYHHMGTTAVATQSSRDGTRDPCNSCQNTNAATTEAPSQPKHCRTQFSTVKLVRESDLWAHSDMVSHRAEKENRVFLFVNELGFLRRPLDLCTFTQNEVKYYPV
jgi:hypothetical protein